MNSADLIAIGLIALQGGFVLMMVVYLISGLDDLFIDILFFVLSISRRLSSRRKWSAINLTYIAETPEQPFALMFPAWHEAAIIRQALINTIQNIDYRNFHVFVGTYVNDPETQQEVRAVMRRHGNVTQIVVPHPGPTCKADCLNWIIKGIREYQERTNTRFAGVVLHDAEDVVDTLSLKLFNWMMPQYDLVQIPIISLKRPWWNMTGGHYMDEFAEAHCKEMHVREWFAGIVPGAGVGTGYSMRALNAAAASSDGETFATDSLTEDYEFSFRVHELGLKQTFVQFPIDRRVPHRTLFGHKPLTVVVHDFITTREFFPDVFWASVRQKTRWVIGISLQGWRKFGWRGRWRVRYLYFRDRKGLFTQQFMALGYVVALGLGSLQLSSVLFPNRYLFAPPLEDDSPLWYLFYINVGLLANRLIHRHIWTCRLYGWSQIPLILPRYFLANVVNYLAVTRATIRYMSHLWTGKKIGWDKTAHTFPGEELLVAYRRRLGDILLERGLLTEDKLREGLAAQISNGRPLGTALVDIGALDEGALVAALCDQLRLEPAPPLDPYAVPIQVLGRISEEIAKTYSAFPFEQRDDGTIALGCSVIPDQNDLIELETTIGARTEFRLAPRGEVAFALRRGYERLSNSGNSQPQTPAIGSRLIAAGIVDSVTVQEALVRQRAHYRALGELLIDTGAISYPDLVKALPAAARRGERLGDYLLAQGTITVAQLADALERQKAYERRLGELIGDTGAASRASVEQIMEKGESLAMAR